MHFPQKDPFELNRNVSGGFGESGFDKFMYYCKKAEEILDDLTKSDVTKVMFIFAFCLKRPKYLQ